MPNFTPTEEHDKPVGNYIDKAGRYTLKIAKIDKRQTNGKFFEDVYLETIDTGDKMKLSISCLPQAEFMWFLLAKSCGIRIAKGSNLTDELFIGKSFEADVTMTEPNDSGKSFAEIKASGLIYDADSSLWIEPEPSTPAPTQEEPKGWEDM